MFSCWLDIYSFDNLLNTLHSIKKAESLLSAFSILE